MLVLCLQMTIALMAHADVRVTLRSGATLSGRLVERKKEAIILRTQGSIKTIPMTDVRSVDLIAAPTGDILAPFIGSPPTALSPRSAQLLMDVQGYADPTPKPETASGMLLPATPESPTADELAALLASPEIVEATLENDLPEPVTDERDLIHLNSGGVLKGYLCEETDEHIVVLLPYGRIKIPRDQVQRVELVGTTQ